MKVFDSRLGRLGNAIFRYFASSLFCIFYNADRIYNPFENKQHFNDIMFINWMNYILENDKIPQINNLIYEFYGYYQHDKIYVKFKQLLVNHMKNNLDDLIFTDGNDNLLNITHYSYNAQSFFVKDIINIPNDIPIYDVVIHLRLEDFITINSVIDPNVIIKLINEINKDNIVIVLNKPTNEIEHKYIDYIKTNCSKYNITIESNNVLKDFYIMSKAKILVCSNSTLSWIASFLSEIVHTVYFPNKNKENHETFCKPINNTIYYDIILCSKDNLIDILFNKPKLKPKINLCWNDCKNIPISDKLIDIISPTYNGFFIEIGAYDGLFQSNTYFLENDYKWKGILIEPSSNIYNDLIKNRNNICINKCLVSSTFNNNKILGAWNHGPMSSVNNIRNLSNVNLTYCETDTLNNIVKTNNIEEIDLLTINTEGYEYEVLDGFNFNIKPKYILINLFNNNKNKIIKKLKKYNYDLIQNITNFNLNDNPSWDQTHNLYLFKYEDIKFDIVIPVGPNDYNKLISMLENTKKNIIGYRNIFVISNIKNINKSNYKDIILIDENIFPFNFKYINSLKNNTDKNRSGWYFQQLIKLYCSFFINDMLPNYLIIDTDTNFLKPTCFFKNGLPLYNIGTEYNIPYFNHMKLLHPSLYKKNNNSGICHHMIFQKNIISDLFYLIENFHKKQFYQVFLENINSRDWAGSGASEYEIYFNYLCIYHPNKFKIRELKWTNSSQIINNNNYDYISCHWYL